MLTKALLTGGLLSLLSGSIVYFGMDAGSSNVIDEDVRVELDETVLAGGETVEKNVTETTKTIITKAIETPETQTSSPDETVQVAETSKVDPSKTTPPQSDKPKTKWLDQYLKSDSKDSEVVDDNQKGLQIDPAPVPSPKVEPKQEADSRSKRKAAMEKRSDKPKSRTREEILEMMRGAAKRPVTDQSIVDAARKDGPGSGFVPPKDMQEKIQAGRKLQSQPKAQDLPLKLVDYDRVMDEARKLQVLDMRDQAFLEIVDYAIDRGDIGNAADVVSELSKPELRDTARARIGVGLAKRGNMNAAFAVLDELEIDELSSTIRLEIIAALMATREERRAPLRERGQ